MVDTPRPGEPFGRYRIVRRIGQGGMGTVYEAVQENLGRSVALKVLLPQLSDDVDFRARFAREALALAALDSPHAIQVYDHGEESDQLFIATQLIKGPDLQRLVAERGPLPLSMALDVVAQVASGLADAHGVGILHRDIKPSNVLLREGHSDVHAYLCDFGIARAEDDDHTITGGVAGTVGFMAPERHHGAPADVHTDIYALGCLLWVLISGQLPYAGNSGVQMALAHMHQPVPQLGGGSSVLVAVDAVLARAMDKRPDHRYGSAVEMRRDLLAAAAAAKADDSADHTVLRAPADATELRSPVQIAPVAVSTASGRQRSRALAGAAAVALVVVLGGVGVALAGTGGDDQGGATEKQNASASSSPSADAGQDGASDSGSASAAPGEVDSSEPSTRKRNAPKSSAPSLEPVEPVESVTSTPSPAPMSTAPAATFSCWSGIEAATREACGLPTGSAGLSTVFPSMAGCQSSTPTVAGKVEVYECGYGDFLVRYTRWAEGFDRYGYLDGANGVDGAEWYAQGEFAGRQWTSYEVGAGEKQPYQWSASFRYYPYSVSVEGTSEAARQRGLAVVAVTPPSRIGLR